MSSGNELPALDIDSFPFSRLAVCHQEEMHQHVDHGGFPVPLPGGKAAIEFDVPAEDSGHGLIVISTRGLPLSTS